MEAQYTIQEEEKSILLIKTIGLKKITVLHYLIETKEFISGYTPIPADEMINFTLYVAGKHNLPFTIYNVKNYSGYTRETFSSHDRANDYLEANDKGDKDLCVSSQTVNRTPFNFNMLGVETGRYRP